MQSPIELLQYRINAVETIFFGENFAQYPDDPRAVKNRIENLFSNVALIENEVPGMKTCFDLVMKLKPHILSKRAAIQSVEDNVEELLSLKKSLLESLNDLALINQLSPFALDSERFRGLIYF
jgi:archaellum component FlaC